MRKKIVITNIILLLISLALCSGVSLYLSRRNVANNARKNLAHYGELVTQNIYTGNDMEYNNNILEQIEPNIRITSFNYLKNKDQYVIISDNIYGKDCEDFADVKWLSLSEFKPVTNGENSTVTKIDSQSKTRMMYYVVKITRTANTDMYIRIGLPYNQLFEDNTSFVLFLVLISLAVFLFASALMSQNISSSLKPINEVIGSLEQLATSETKEYNFQNIEDVSVKINDVKNELEHNLKSIKAEKSKVELILENMGQGLIALNWDYSVNLINNYALNLLFEKEIDYNKSFIELGINEELKDNIIMVHDDLGHASFDVKVNDLYYNYTINVISNIWGDGESRRIIIVITDVTDEKLVDMRQKEFFSNASHELRSPLTSIIGFQELICEDFVNPGEVKDLCKKTLAEGKRMQSLINDMLDLSALEKEEKGEVTKIYLKDMVDEIVDSLEPQLLIDNLSVEKDMDNSCVIANQKHIYQLIRNLIDNAIKYNRLNGKIYVTIKNEKKYVLIRVKDTGMGISEKDQTQIFERFFRVDKARSRKLGSSGLGLAIVRQVCNIYAATLNLESKLNEGTTFTIKFPKEK